MKQKIIIGFISKFNTILSGPPPTPQQPPSYLPLKIVQNFVIQITKPEDLPFYGKQICQKDFYFRSL